ncbi:MAG: ureidoglycolate lyase [Pseudomonadota bacterium]
MSTITVEPLTPEAFAPFGEVLRPGLDPTHINEGRCERHDMAARLAFLGGGAPGIALFRSEAVSLPYDLTLLEHHPLGSQAFMPAAPCRWMVIVALDEAGRPGRPRAFLPAPGVGVNLAAGCWHGVLTPLDAPADFWVLDRGGPNPSANLVVHAVEPPITVLPPAEARP